ncbi:hypothetical protein Back2_02140 [Nocardioides baekrokdamisoli]|uniref:Uncharacterized protein n=1 Tax=Nocardioides baekrokdamisoli TaxID=1804624 RepID=A0A3G9IAX7_9ACTN|nr:DUF5703 family protein [Nocardioides baekrokdamisoli]BBH15927.1 hypothetical protein Back2_02140 [Nocardioides baekrokdamisoli]
MGLIERRPPRDGVEWEFDEVSFSSDLSRSAVRQLLVERAEYGGWTLDRLRIGRDGRRQVLLRRKIIRAQRTA